MRPLTLHASALNDDEYDLYTTSLNDLAWADDKDTQAHDDAYYEHMQIGVREARGWLRGRYAHLPPGAIDAILRFFSPGLSQTDALTGGQFFAALRLVVHAENGKDVDRALAFVQAHPSMSAFSKRLSVEAISPSAMPHRDPGRAPPTPVSSTRASEGQTGSNPFSAPQPPVHPSQRIESVKSPHTTHNPFVVRSSTDARPPLPPRKPAPPAPPHPMWVPPPKHGSILLSSASRKSTSPTRPSSSVTPVPVPVPVPVPNSSPNPGAPNHHPPVPPKPAHVTSTLMKQSLQASKAAQTMKRAEEQLERERVLQVLKSSAVVSGGYTLGGARVSRSSVVVGTQVRSTLNRSLSPGKVVVNTGPGDGEREGENEERGRAPPLPRRRQTHMQQQPSPPVSVSSLEQVALARASTDSSSSSSVPPPPPPSRSLTNPFPSATDNNPFHRALPDQMQAPGKSYITTTTTTSSPQNSPTHGPIDLPPTRPPTHPDRKPSAFPFTSPLYQGSPFHNPSPFASHGENNTTTTTTVTPESSPTTRVFRSKSLHHPSPPLPPLPTPTPPRRKRPESVQVLGSVSGAGSVFGDGAEMVYPRQSGLARHTSFSSTPPDPARHKRQSSFSTASSVGSASAAAGTGYNTSRSDGTGVGVGLVGGAESSLHKLAKTWQPRLEKARYKAEAGLSRRGYIRERDVVGRRSGSHGRGGEDKEELLMTGVRAGEGKGGYAYGEENGEDGYEYEPPSVDGLSLDGSDVDDGEDGEGRGTKGRRVEGRERDGMKWPVAEGEGWRPL